MQSILAINGGKPVSEKPIQYGKQFLDEKDYEAVLDVLKSDFLTVGPKIIELEEKLCEITTAKYATAISNGTTALHAAVFAAGVGPGDEVIVSSITFAASSNCVLYCGGTPVFADIDPHTYNISVDSIKKLITKNTKAIVAVDFTGQAVQADEIRDICDEHNLVFIQDSAHSIGTKYNNKPIGSVADITTFSFHPVKTITSGEGGAVMTDNFDFHKKIQLLGKHGITRDPVQMVHENQGDWYYEQILLGNNYRMTEFQAALLISQLDKLNMFAERRKKIVKRYNEEFSEVGELIIQKEIKESDTVRHLYIIQLDPNKLNGSRKDVFDALKAENIICNVHYIPVYYHPYYEKLGYTKGICPNAEHFYENAITIPLFFSMSEQDVSDVIYAVKKVINYYRK